MRRCSGRMQTVNFKPDANPVSDIESDVLETAEPRDAPIRCAACLSIIALDSDRIPFNGAHIHTFANPHGLVFEIGCFQDAPGCHTAGLPTDEFTWFIGYFWQIAVCQTCLSHLGWLFTAKSRGFWGLILDRLIQE